MTILFKLWCFVFKSLAFGFSSAGSGASEGWEDSSPWFRAGLSHDTWAGSTVDPCVSNTHRGQVGHRCCHWLHRGAFAIACLRGRSDYVLCLYKPLSFYMVCGIGTG